MGQTLPPLHLLLPSIFIALLSLLSLRLLFILSLVGKPHAKRLKQQQQQQQPLRTLIVLGSGGHTAEMLSLLSALSFLRYSPRIYVAGRTDSLSLDKARRVEEAWAAANSSSSSRSATASPPPLPLFLRIFRSREVGQSYLSSLLTTLVAMLHAAWIVLRTQPDLVLANGPGTCLPICVCGFLLKVFGISNTSLIYVESVARVQKLSLTGLLLHKLMICDQFYVQWPKLLKKYPGTTFVGRLM